jgi:hypothetical protein
LNQYIGRFRSLQGALQESEMIPTSQLVNGVMEADKGFKALLKKLKVIEFAACAASFIFCSLPKSP